MSWRKKLILDALDREPFRSVLERFTRGRATIFMLHRFSVPEVGVEGIDPNGLQETLEYLRRRHYEMLPLPEVLERLAGRGETLRRAVAFTIDDGYFDQVDVAAPIFAKYDCPVTTFVCTGFVDRELWMWWDKIEHLFESTDRRSLEIPFADGPPLAYRWNDDGERRRAQLDFTNACKQIDDHAKHEAIAALSEAAGVDLPAHAPDVYAPLEWNALRGAEAQGMRFAPHTVTHPVLSRTPDEQSAREIAASKVRLAEEARHPEDVFCYPNGQAGDFGPREFETLRALGFQGAVVGWEGYGEPRHFGADPDQRFQINRFSYSPDPRDIIQCVSGFERVKALLRGAY